MAVWSFGTPDFGIRFQRSQLADWCCGRTALTDGTDRAHASPCGCTPEACTHRVHRELTKPCVPIIPPDRTSALHGLHSIGVSDPNGCRRQRERSRRNRHHGRDRTRTYSPAAQGGGGLRRLVPRCSFSLTKLFHLPDEQAGVAKVRNAQGVVASEELCHVKDLDRTQVWASNRRRQTAALATSTHRP